MPILIDANLKLMADRLHINSSRMREEYGMSTVDEIIESEAEKGNISAINYAKDYGSSPEKLVELFRLFDVENRYTIIKNMDRHTKMQVLPLLEQEDLIMGLNFFTQEKLLKMLLKVDIVELIRVTLEAFPFAQMIEMMTEEDLAGFFANKDLKKTDVLEQMTVMPPEIMQKFVEGVTGRPAEETNPMELIASIGELPDDKFHKFMASIDPDVQRQLTFQLTSKEPKYLTLFDNMTYVKMLSKLMKPDMVKSMAMLEQKSVIGMLQELPGEFISVIGSQVNPKSLAVMLQNGHMSILEKALIR